jgi:hypothetical protein
MSTREHEYGTLTFTNAGYTDVMRAYRSAYNQYMSECYALAMQTYDALAQIKGRYAGEKQKNAFASLKKRPTIFDDNFGLATFSSNTAYTLLDSRDLELIEAELFRGKKGNLTKPRALSFPKLTNKLSSFDLECNSFGELKFNKDSLSIMWETEGPSIVSRAKASPLYKLFNLTLSRYTWRRNEGGVFYYCDEHMEEGSVAAGDPITLSISELFGPKGIALSDNDHTKPQEATKDEVRAFMRTHGCA